MSENKEELKKQFIKSELKPGLESLYKIETIKPTLPKTKSKKEEKKKK